MSVQCRFGSRRQVKDLTMAGEKGETMKKAVTLAVGLLVATVVVFGCGSKGQELIRATEPPKTEVEPSKTYKVGDTVEYKDHVVTLNSAEVEKDIYLVISLTIRNTGTKIFDVSPGEVLRVEDSQGRQGAFYHYYVYGKESIGGTLQPGKSMSGKTAFKVEPDATGIKIYYQPAGEALVAFEVD